MTAFLFQLWTLLSTGYLSLYLAFFLFIYLTWWTKVYIASKNRDYTKKYSGTMAVIIPVFNEDPADFERNVKSIIRYGKPKQLIISIDNSPEATEKLKRVAYKYADKVLLMPRQMGKREQFYRASRLLKKVDVVVTVDSDTYWDKTTMNILKPFNDPKVGGVSGRQVIYDAEHNYIRRIANWLEDLRFRVNLPFQSYFGKVVTIPGRTLAVRASLYKDISKTIRHERFLGRKLVTSDDGSMTIGVLERGYKTVYQSDSLVHTDGPSTYTQFRKQYLRWYRNTTRRFFQKFFFFVRLNPLIFLSRVRFIFGGLFYVGLLITLLFKLQFELYKVTPATGLELSGSYGFVLATLLILGYFASSYLRNLPHLIHNKRDIVFLPIYASFMLVTMLPLKMMALFSFFENGWMTRSSTKKTVKKADKEPVVATRFAAAGVGLASLVLFVPVSFLVSIAPLNIPFGTIVGGEGPEYYKAAALVKQKSADLQTPLNGALVNDLVSSYSQKHSLTLNTVAIANAQACVKYSVHTNAALYLKRPLDLLETCVNDTIAASSSAAKYKRLFAPKIPSGIKFIKKAEKIYVQAKAGDSETSIMHAQIHLHDPANTLTPVQFVYIESFMVKGIGRDSTIAVGDLVKVNIDTLKQRIEESKHLTPEQITALQPFAAAYY